nr:RHS repeat-associated core domain-containing protein [uncultured Desulfobacter sp.]
MHYNWHRYYDPSSGRYLTPDPIGLAGGINPFVYTLNNPTNLIDPHGLTGLEATIFIGRGLSLPSQTPYGLAFLGGFGVGMVINHYVPYWGEGRLGMDIYDWLHPTPAFEMARGKQTPRNWATEAARQSAQTNNTDPCDELSKMLDEAKCNGDNQKIRDITQAQKFLKCRNRNKRQNHY